jgi:hypothetical protein
MSPLVQRAARGLSLAAFGLAACLLAGAVTAATPRRPVNVEAVYGRQEVLLDRTLASMQALPDDKPRLYFVGFAGFGPEAVFKREVLAVRQLFDERFGTRGRSVALINHQSTLEEIPLANIANLDRTLQRLGRTMDRQRDTLFLFLTSHGEDGLLTVAMPGFRLRHLTPAHLKTAPGS